MLCGVRLACCCPRRLPAFQTNHHPRRKACVASGAATPFHLDVSDLLQHYGKAPGVLDQRAVEQACTAIMACQVCVCVGGGVLVAVGGTR